MILVIVAVFLLGVTVVGVARGPTPEVLIAFAPIEASFVMVAYPVRPDPGTGESSSPSRPNVSSYSRRSLRPT